MQDIIDGKVDKKLAQPKIYPFNQLDETLKPEVQSLKADADANVQIPRSAEVVDSGPKDQPKQAQRGDMNDYSKWNNIKDEEEISEPEVKPAPLTPAVPTPKAKSQKAIKADKLRIQGNMYFKSSSYTRAIEAYSQAIEFSTAPPKANVDTNDPFAFFEQFSVKKPDPRLFTNRAICYHKLGQFENCIADCESSLQLVESVKAHWFRSLSFFSLEKFQDATIDLIKLKEWTNTDEKVDTPLIEKQLKTVQLCQDGNAKSHLQGLLEFDKRKLLAWPDAKSAIKTLYSFIHNGDISPFKLWKVDMCMIIENTVGLMEKYPKNCSRTLFQLSVQSEFSQAMQTCARSVLQTLAKRGNFDETSLATIYNLLLVTNISIDIEELQKEVLTVTPNRTVVLKILSLLARREVVKGYKQTHVENFVKLMKRGTMEPASLLSTLLLNKQHVEYLKSIDGFSTLAKLMPDSMKGSSPKYLTDVGNLTLCLSNCATEGRLT
jgi:tetratricopeptide (TPR) repeat protein